MQTQVSVRPHTATTPFEQRLATIRARLTATASQINDLSAGAHDSSMAQLEVERSVQAVSRLLSNMPAAEELPAPVEPQMAGFAADSEQGILIPANSVGQYSALEAAVAAADAGCTLRLQRGTHRLTQPLVVEKDLILIGEGIENTHVIGVGSEVLRASGVRLRTRDITFRHEGDAPGDIVSLTAGEGNFERCGFIGAVLDKEKNAKGVGLRITSGAKATVNGCRAAQNGHSGFAVHSSNVDLIGNTSEGNGASGIVYWGDAFGILNQNRCRDNGKNGIYVTEQASPTLAENSCEKNGDSGLAFFGDSAPVVRANVSANNGRYGIYVGEKSNPSVERNTTSGNESSGLAFFGESAGVAKHNTSVRNSKDGIVVGESASPHIELNECVNNGEAGMSYYGQSAGSAIENDCNENGHSGIYVDDRACPDLERNKCSKNQGSGLMCVGESRSLVSHNDCVRNQGSGIYVGGSAGPNLDANECSGNAQNGITYAKSSTGMAKGNVCRDNERQGICLGDAAMPTLEANVCCKNSQAGLAYFGTAAGTAAKNNCSDNAMGIFIGQQAVPNLLGNVCAANAKDGITFRDTAGGSAALNTCENNGEDGLYVARTARPVLGENRCSCNAVHNVRDERR